MNASVEEPRKKTALVVDDGPVERMAGKTMLEKLGYAVTTAGSGEEALACLELISFDLALCDISMPGMGGLDLLETTCNQAGAPPFVMLTNHDDAGHALAAIQRGAYGYLTKPLRFELLHDTLAEALSRYERDQTARHVTRSSRFDHLTGLMSRAEFSRLLAERVTYSAEGCGALLLFKLTGLNHINHSYSRSEGDHILKAAADSLGQQIRQCDLLARFGGDLFAIHLSEIAHAGVEERAAGIARTVEAVKLVLAGDAYSLNLVAGGACIETAMGIEDLLNRADFALHLARQHGRSKVHIYSEADEVHKRELAHQLNTLALVRAALDDPRRMAMHYQPITHLESGKVSHHEALLRMFDENGKPCNAGELVKTCEVFGLIGRLDRAVVSACLNDLPKLPDGDGVAINLSGKSIGDPALLEFIETRIAVLGIDPARLIFELTETAAFNNLEEVRHFVKRIKDLGCRFALDDFGVGFSSFYYIKELDFDYLKLDGSFIKNLPRNANDQVFVRAMVEISRVFGLSVIAEWVEDQETVDLLKGFKVEYGQGWHFGKPVPAGGGISGNSPGVSRHR